MNISKPQILPNIIPQNSNIEKNFFQNYVRYSYEIHGLPTQKLTGSSPPYLLFSTNPCKTENPDILVHIGINSLCNKTHVFNDNLY